MRGSCAVLLLLAVARVAAADSLQDAKQHYERANAAYALGRFAEAAAEFEKAFDLKPDPALLYNAAQAYRVSGNRQRALLLYQSYLRVFGDQATNADEARRHIDDLKKSIAAEEQARAKQPAASTPPATASTQNPLTATPSVRARPAPLTNKKRHAIIFGVIGGVAAVGLAVGLGVGLTYGRPVETTLPKAQYP